MLIEHIGNGPDSMNIIHSMDIATVLDSNG